jgi:hypothetical protein
MLALDAKSGPRFRRAQERLHESADYLWLIHDPHTGHQPLRQLFLIHRDADALPICNVPGYLEGKAVPAEARILGALPAWPGGTDLLARAIARFLETQMGRG